MLQSIAMARAPESNVAVVQVDGTHPLADCVASADQYSFGAMPWLRAWASAFLPGQGWRGPMQLYAACDTDDCYGFVALADQVIKGVTVKSLAGYYWPFRTVCASADTREREWFACAIAEHFSRHSPSAALRFGPIKKNDDGVRGLLSALYREGWVGLRKNAGSAFHLELPAEQADIARMMSLSLHKNLQYLRRRLQKEGLKIAYERHQLQGQGCTLLHDLQKIERGSWVSRPGGHPKFIGQAEERFFAALTELADCGARPVVWILRCGEEPVAFSFHIETGDVIYIVANSYDGRWKHYSPGSLLTYEVLSEACARSVRQIDWGRGDSGYKSRWGASASEALCDVLMFRPGLIGRATWTLAKKALPGWSAADDLRSF